MPDRVAASLHCHVMLRPAKTSPAPSSRVLPALSCQCSTLRSASRQVSPGHVLSCLHSPVCPCSVQRSRATSRLACIASPFGTRCRPIRDQSCLSSPALSYRWLSSTSKALQACIALPSGATIATIVVLLCLHCQIGPLQEWTCRSSPTLPALSCLVTLPCLDSSCHVSPVLVLSCLHCRALLCQSQPVRFSSRHACIVMSRLLQSGASPICHVSSALP
jgi:hypothetical protein